MWVCCRIVFVVTLLRSVAAVLVCVVGAVLSCCRVDVSLCWCVALLFCCVVVLAALLFCCPAVVMFGSVVVALCCWFVLLLCWRIVVVVLLRRCFWWVACVVRLFPPRFCFFLGGRVFMRVVASVCDVLCRCVVCCGVVLLSCCVAGICVLLVYVCACVCVCLFVCVVVHVLVCLFLCWCGCVWLAVVC